MPRWTPFSRSRPDPAAAAGQELPAALSAVSSAMQLHLSFAAGLADPGPYQSQIALTQQVQALVVARLDAS